MQILSSRKFADEFGARGSCRLSTTTRFMYGLVPTQKKKRKSTAPGSTSASRVTILLEDIQGKVQATMEAVTGFRSELRSEIEVLRTELSQRIDLLELAVRQHSADIRELRDGMGELRGGMGEMRGDIREMRGDIREMREDIRKNTEEIRQMRELLERKADRDALLKLEARVQVLEHRLGIQ
jgi:chromosome segregation ATPase